MYVHVALKKYTLCRQCYWADESYCEVGLAANVGLCKRVDGFRRNAKVTQLDLAALVDENI